MEFLAIRGTPKGEPMENEALRAAAEFGAALLVKSENREHRILLCKNCDRLFVSREFLADGAAFRTTCARCLMPLMGRIDTPLSMRDTMYPDSPIYLTELDDLRPLTSPHPAFGKKPGWFTRHFGSEDERYWPTVRDARNYRRHMEESEQDRDVEAISGRYKDPYFDHRMKVKHYRDRLCATPKPLRPWWAELGDRS